MIAEYEALLDQLIADGVVPVPWRPAFAATPRHEFIPSTIWDGTRGVMVPVHRDQEPERWLKIAYTDDAVVTQMEDGRDTGGETPWLKSSSSTAPSVVAMMLDRLDVAIDHRVLEIGTGTGWNAALLAARLGDEQVVTMEVDPQIANRARKALGDAGHAPIVVTVDGALGYPAGAPYDRILATAAVQRVPHAWVKQTRPGGRIVTPWGTPYDNGALLELDVHDHHVALGRFSCRVGFMWLRAQRASRGAVEDVVHPRDTYDETFSDLHPWEPIGDDDGRFAVGLRLPNCKSGVVGDEDKQDNHFVAYLLDPAGGSWASVHVEPDMTGDIPVRQHGPRRLWDEIEVAHKWWVDAGKPEFTRFGITVRADKQWIWLDQPELFVGRL